MHLYNRLRTVKPAAWVLLVGVVIFSAIPVIIKITGIVSPTWSLFTLQPLMAAAIAGVAYFSGRDIQDRARHKNEKIVLIMSVLAIWFVIYFLSGLVTTYVQNTLVTSVGGVLLNVFAYGTVAVAIEYVRHRSILIAGLRNAIWFGIIVTIIFALGQMNLAQLSGLHSGEDLIKTVFVDIVPAIVSSLLLTYLAQAGGFGSMLVYRLGTLAILLLPPIIPKYDWYLIGASSILLAVVIFIVIDRSIQSHQGRQFTQVHYRHHIKRASDIMLVFVMVGMVMFMTGVFTYKPLTIMSDSMKPVFSRGSTVIVQKISNTLDIRVGDIVQYESSDKMITHRVVEINPGDNGSDARVFITKGDNSPSRDRAVLQSQIVGIVRAGVPYVGYPTVWLRDFTK